MTPFAKRVYQIVRRIQKGKVLTYKQVAVAVGNPGAYRAVGTILSKNFDPKIPCHRVVRSDGKAGNWNRGNRQKRTLLKQEGLII